MWYQDYNAPSCQDQRTLRGGGSADVWSDHWHGLNIVAKAIRHTASCSALQRVSISLSLLGSALWPLYSYFRRTLMLFAGGCQRSINVCFGFSLGSSVYSFLLWCSSSSWQSTSLTLQMLPEWRPSGLAPAVSKCLRAPAFGTFHLASCIFEPLAYLARVLTFLPDHRGGLRRRSPP
jgi:hypothetical protein